jgi:hypothetical protein
MIFVVCSASANDAFADSGSTAPGDLPDRVGVGHAVILMV